jgi:fermentation-respiration switch protein FrsA (DUF1100 family)
MLNRSRWKRAAAVGVAVALAAVPACSSSGSSSGPTSTSRAANATTTTKKTTATTTKTTSVPATKVTALGTYAVGLHQENWVDSSRPTQANKTAPALPQRTLPAIVLYPAKGSPGPDQVKDGAPVAGRFPLVLFSHGVTGKGTDYVATLRLIASAGYVVVAPTYPLSNRDAPGGASIADVPAQVKDVPFLLDKVLAENKGPGYLHDLIDPDGIALAGHSLGAITSLGAGYTSCCAAKRVKAVAEWAGLFFSDDSKPEAAPTALAPIAAHRPLLMIHGTADGTVPYTVTKGVYAAVGTPKVFISLPGEGHIPPYVTGETSPAAKVVTDATVDFFDAELKGDRSALNRLSATVTRAGPTVATLQEDLG